MKLAEAHTKLNQVDKTKAPMPGKNKGDRGQWVESQIGLDLSSNLNDFEDGELKTFKSGQTIAVTMVNHCLKEIVESAPYKDSNVGKKLYNVLFVKFAKSGEFVKSVVFNPQTHQDLYNKLEEDYNYICDRIRESYETGQILHTTNGKNKLLQIRTKGNKTKLGGYIPLEYNGRILKDKPMAFYLTTTFEKQLFN
tara:strand:+ start:209 stop:793 length:585 start_codon:yes stop_codon:yes gene_type:complete